MASVRPGGHVEFDGHARTGGRMAVGVRSRNGGRNRVACSDRVGGGARREGNIQAGPLAIIDGEIGDLFISEPTVSVAPDGRDGVA